MKIKLSLIAVAAGVAMAISGSGCGPGYSKTEFKVTLDGVPVAGATVLLTPADDTTTQSASGLTNAEGVCAVTSLGKSGVPKGNYKVTVVKTAGVKDAGMEDMGKMDPTKAFAEMEKRKQKEERGEGPGGNQGAAGTTTKRKDDNELPAKYSVSQSTPLTVTIPVSGVQKLELVSDKAAPAK